MRQIWSFDGFHLGFYREKVHTARKLQSCHECKELIFIGVDCYCVVSKFVEKYPTSHEIRFLCVACMRDWKSLMNILSVKEAERQKCMCLIRLDEAILAAFEADYLNPIHPLLKRWQPNIFEEYRYKYTTNGIHQSNYYVSYYGYDRNQKHLPFFTEQLA